MGFLQVGSQQSAVSSRQSTVGSQQLSVGSRLSAVSADCQRPTADLTQSVHTKNGTVGTNEKSEKIYFHVQNQ